MVPLLAVALVGAAGCGGSDEGTVPLGDPEGNVRTPNAAARVIDGAVEAGQLYIPKVAVNAPILARGTEVRPNPFAGGQEMESFGVPPDRATTAWWSDGPQIGSEGLAIILGHAQTGKGYAVFDRIGSLKPKDVITVETPDGDERAIFQVLEVVSGISKRDPAALQKVLEEAPPNAHLALITCGGDADYSAMATDENVVVFATRAV